MGMFGTPVHLQLGEHPATQPVPGQHAADGPTKGFLRSVEQKSPVGAGTEATRVAGMAIHSLIGSLRTSQHHFGGVDDHNVVTSVLMRGEDRLVLPPEDLRHLGGQATQDQAVSVDNVPGPLNVSRLRRVGGHRRTSLQCGLERLPEPRSRWDAAPSGDRYRPITIRGCSLPGNPLPGPGGAAPRVWSVNTGPTRGPDREAVPGDPQPGGRQPRSPPGYRPPNVAPGPPPPGSRRSSGPSGGRTRRQ